MHLDIRNIIAHPIEFDRSMINRGEKIRAEEVIQSYQNWKECNLKTEAIASKINLLSKKFSPENRTEVNALNKEKEGLELALQKHRTELDYILDRIPNLLEESVPIGSSADENQVIEYCGKKPDLDKPMHHEDIAVKLGMWGRDEAVSMSGSRFVCLKDKLARLERILGQFVLDRNIENGFTEISVPFLVHKNALYKTGQLPKFSEDFFQFDDFALIPTGEIPLINLYANKTINTDLLPIKLTAQTPCFRSEAGALGRDTKGLIRVHQFQKVEMVIISNQESSKDMHLLMLERVKEILNDLELHYRVIEICSGDIGFTAARQFDVEVWMPGQNKYVEVASCSNCHDFQARRMKTKYKTKDGLKFVHTLNCTAIACGRILAALLETYCTSGEFVVPKALYGYWGRVKASI